MAMPVQVSRCMLGMGALLYFFERWVSFFSKIANTPPGVLPLLPLLIVDRPIRMPLRYTCIVCCGMLTSTTTGPLGESCGFHQYSPGLSVPVGLPIGDVPDTYDSSCLKCSDPSTRLTPAPHVSRTENKLRVDLLR